VAYSGVSAAALASRLVPSAAEWQLAPRGHGTILNKSALLPEASRWRRPGLVL
jgi:hypothetical protein